MIGLWQVCMQKKLSRGHRNLSRDRVDNIQQCSGKYIVGLGQGCIQKGTTSVVFGQIYPRIGQIISGSVQVNIQLGQGRIACKNKLSIVHRNLSRDRVDNIQQFSGKYIVGLGQGCIQKGKTSVVLRQIYPRIGQIISGSVQLNIYYRVMVTLHART